ncbi:hypothetical protein GCM10007359_00170 [Rothia aerolata]|uniref:6-phospho-beta-glucosidase n=1 Tax=Rothia aerolata TaxID=1812262 RepID=A0A917IJF5_9MICC|nr:family 1 glycosylhydrolase [Rothia aerolata]GGH56254.1 hypothetical protein GCM10007359_00170 [Rothia aerolata]
MYRKKLKPFPQGFLWSASTSAYQSEGAWNEDGRGPIRTDIREDLPEGTADFKITSDHYHRFKEDIALMAEMGFRAYRFPSLGPALFPTATEKLTRRVSTTTTRSLMSCSSTTLSPL